MCRHDDEEEDDDDDKNDNDDNDDDEGVGGVCVCCEIVALCNAISANMTGDGVSSTSGVC